MISIRAVGLFSDLVNLTCTGLPTGGSCTFFPNPSAPGTVSLSVTAGPPDPVFGGSFAVIGTSGAHTQTYILSLSIVDFTVSVSPASQAITPGTTAASSQVSITAVSASSVTGISSSFDLSCSGLPAGANCNFFPNPAALGNTPLTIGAVGSTLGGNFTVTVNATSGAVTRTATVNLTVADFTLSVSPASQSVSAGGAVTYAVSVSSRGNFSGPVNLSCSGLPSQASCSFSPNPSAPGTATLTLSTLANTLVGSIPFTVTGISGAIMRAATATLTVTQPFPPPTFTSASVVNSASFQAGASAGSIITIFGLNLASQVNGVVQATSLPLPTQLMGISVTINGIPAPLFAVANVGGQQQINLQIPLELAGHTSVTIIVNNNGVLSAPITVNLAPAAPGIFTFDGINGAILHGSDFRPVTPSSPAAKGEAVVLYGTGLGPVSPAPATGQAASSSPLSLTIVTPAVTVGGVNAIVLFSGLAPGFVGLNQVNFVVPFNVASGTLDVIIQTGGLSSNTVKLAVQ